jgi:hypothetical protein
MKKIVIMYSVLLIVVGIGIWFDRNRQTDSFTVSFSSGELPQRRVSIESTWKQEHSNVKNPQFGYYSSHDKIVAVFVNYYN